METSSTRIKQIDSLRGLAIFLVVLGHSIIVYPINLHENTLWKIIFDFISTVHLPLFYVISGFCFSYKSDYLNYIYKKIKRILIPFFFFNLIDFVSRTLLPMFVNKNIGLKDYALSIVQSGGQYQFLYILFIIFLIYPIVDKLNNNKTFAILILLVLLTTNLTRLPDSNFCYKLILKYAFYFNIGNLIRKYYKKVFEYKNKSMKVVLYLILWIATFILNMSIKSAILSIVTSICAIVFCYYLMSFDVSNRILNDFGKYSLQLYLIDAFALTISRYIICKVTSIPIVIVLFNMLCDFFVAYICVKWILQKSKIIKFLLGA